MPEHSTDLWSVMVIDPEGKEYIQTLNVDRAAPRFNTNAFVTRDLTKLAIWLINRAIALRRRTPMINKSAWKGVSGMTQSG